ncbi:MAG: outer membrane protein OmpA-like peptidoglycan-associated protein [Limisphaerales bacterium]|jgi:outer membrane protein OmpA-like peptidoglycan-associated protein/tetratricopeptide (TPR) repeat protein
MPFRILSILVLLCFCATENIQAQSKLKQADAHFKSFAFSEAIPIYKELVMTSKDKEDAATLEASIRLAECYRLTNQLEKAEPYYAKAVEQENILPVFLLYYAQALQSNGKCADAINWYRRFTYFAPEDKRGIELQSSCADITDLVGPGTEYEILPVSFNSSASEYSPFIYKEGLVFTSTRITKKGTPEDGWTGEAYSNLYFTAGEKEHFTRTGILSQKLQTNLNDGPASFNGTGNTIYFSKNGNGKKNNSKHGGITIQLFKSSFSNEEWGKAESLSFCDPSFDEMHPSISPDGSILFFSSNRKGGLGGMDIWKVEFAQNTWSEPVNLGPLMNTPGNEVFPFIHDDGNLYFASDGHRGLGGMDIFEARFKGGRYIEATNMRSPINSPRDDFGLVFDPEKNQGYFSSNRSGGRGGDDIYSLTKFPLFAEGILIAAETMDPLSAARIIMTHDGDQIQQVRTDSEGKFVLRVSPYEKYTVTAYREGYNATEIEFSTNRENPDKLIIALEELIDPNRAIKLEVKIISKTDKRPVDGAQLFLRNESNGNVQTLITNSNGTATLVIDKGFSYTIAGDKDKYFNVSESLTPEMLDGRTITRVLELEPYEIGLPLVFTDVKYVHGQTRLDLNALLELDKLSRLMITNPSMVIEIGSHTDSNGSNTTNDRLSKRRADEVVDYLIAQGITSNRLVGVGYGESQLVNHCSNGMICPEQLHRENRRTEWKILSY